MPYGKAFWIESSEARTMGFGRIVGAEAFIRPYINGRDINQHSRKKYVLDFHNKDESFVRQRFPEAYQRLLERSKPVRQHDKMKYRRQFWWRFGQPSTEMRAALKGLPRFFGTTETASHRIFHALDGTEAPDQKIRVIAVSEWQLFSTLSARAHVEFSFRRGGWQGVGDDPVYQHTNTFDPFPFPAYDEIGAELYTRLGDLGSQLDAFRRERLEAHTSLTMTGLYNVLERMRELEAGANVERLSDKERDIHDMGLVTVLKELHDRIDEAVLEAYGWSDLASELVGKPGGTTPSQHKSEAQAEAEEEMLTRLVALNQERAVEEARGTVRWLRPDYQIPKLGHKVSKPGAEQTEAELAIVAAAEKPAWPKDTLQQIRLVRDTLAKADAPAAPEVISAAFAGRNTAKRCETVKKLLETLAATGAAQVSSPQAANMQPGRERLGEDPRYFIPR